MGQALRSLGSSVGTVTDSIAPGLALAEGAVVSGLFQDAAPTQGPNVLYLPAPDPLSEFHHAPQELAWSSWGIALVNGVMSTGLLSAHWEVGLLPNRCCFLQLQLLPHLRQALEPSHPGLSFPNLSHSLAAFPVFSCFEFCFFST